jgi:hypothetical protein
MPVLAKLVEMRAISVRPAGAFRPKTKPNLRCPGAVPLYVLQPVPEPSGDIFSDKVEIGEGDSNSSRERELQQWLGTPVRG